MRVVTPGRLVVLALFPIFGIVAAVVFRPSERDGITYAPFRANAVLRHRLPLPDGTMIRFLGVPDGKGGVAFWMSETELTASLWRWVYPAAPLRMGAASGMTFAEAQEFCRLLGPRLGHRLRLPAPAEWRQAARAGIPGAPYPWGYGDDPPAAISFARKHPPLRPGPPMGYGFRDLAGGLWEWLDDGTAIGGAWPERNPRSLRIDHVQTFPPDYRGADVGMRLVLEVDKPVASARTSP